MNRADLTSTALVLQDAILSGYDYDHAALLDPIVEHVHDIAKLVGLAEGQRELASVILRYSATHVDGIDDPKPRRWTPEMVIGLLQIDIGVADFDTLGTVVMPPFEAGHRAGLEAAIRDVVIFEAGQHGFVQKIHLKSDDGPHVETSIRFFINNGGSPLLESNNVFYGEMSLPSTPPSKSVEIDYPMNFGIDRGHRIFAGPGHPHGWRMTVVVASE